MKLAAIYNVWDGVELLESSIKCIEKHVDLIIIVYQLISNFGEKYNPLSEIEKIRNHKIILYEYIPKDYGGFINEKNKRNIGIDIARKYNCTHFLHLDTDEMYFDFGIAKQLYIESGKKGSVCQLYTYFKNPKWRFQKPDNYYVPFIHELNENTIAGSGKYPFYVDPTRKINEKDICKLPIFMNHYSWVRNDIYRKVRNSSAKANLERGSMLESYFDPNCKPGFYVKDADNILIESPDYFDLEITLTKSCQLNSFNL